MNFRKMIKSDIDEIALIENDIFKEAWPKEFFDDELENEFAHFYVLTIEDEIIGYGGFLEMFENSDLHTIGIKKEYQGLDYGEKLLRFLIKEAIKLNLEFMHLEVRVSNLKAQKLYKKYNFEEMRIRKAYYSDGEDCIDMVKGLIGLNEEDFSD